MVRTHPDPPKSLIGGIAQLGEHLLCKQGVVGSIPSASTKKTSGKKIRIEAQARECMSFGTGFYRSRLLDL